MQLNLDDVTLFINKKSQNSETNLFPRTKGYSEAAISSLTGWAADTILDTLEDRDQKRMKNQFSNNHKEHNK